MRLSAGVLFFLCASAANANTKSPKECFPTVLSTITHINARPATKEELELFAEMDAKEIRLHNKLTEYETYETFDTQHHPASIIVPNPNNPSEKILIFRKQMTQNHALKIDGLFYETQPHSEMLAKFLSEKLGFSEKVPETYTKSAKIYGQDSVIVYQEYIPDSPSLKKLSTSKETLVGKAHPILEEFVKSDARDDALYLKYVFGNLDMNSGNILKNKNKRITFVDHERILMLEKNLKEIDLKEYKALYKDKTFPLWQNAEQNKHHFHDLKKKTPESVKDFVPKDNSALAVFEKIKTELTTKNESSTLTGIVNATRKEMQSRGLTAEELSVVDKQLVIFEARMRDLVRKLQTP